MGLRFGGLGDTCQCRDCARVVLRKSASQIRCRECARIADRKRVQVCNCGPLLLEALEAIMEQREGRVDRSDRGAWERANEQARAAIAKARGR